MAIEIEELCMILNTISPENLSETWDHSGIQLKTGLKHIATILVSLDITEEVIDEAVLCKADMIITHHPLIFSELYKIDNNTVIGSSIIKLIKANISVYASHTAFDNAKDGNNDYLAKLLGCDSVIFLNEGAEEENSSKLGRICRLDSPITLTEMAKKIKKVLSIEAPLNCVGNPQSLVQKVAICTGAGADLIDYAKAAGCDLFITGDVRYHDAQRAKGIGLALIDAGHYHTEKIFIKNMANQLRDKIKNKATILESKVDQNPFIVL